MDDEVKGLLRYQNTSEESEPESDLDQKPPNYKNIVANDRTEDSLNKIRRVQYGKLPIGIWLLEKTGLLNFKPLLSHKALVLILTFLCYTSYHLSRKPFSVVKVALCPECGKCNVSNVTEPGWPPFNNYTTGNALLGTVDYSWLFAYAITMFISGQIADRVNLRYFLTVGMLGSGISVALLGVAYFAQIHELWYFIIVQVFGGITQSTGWPGTVAVMSHWFGKHNRGFIMGVWNSHTSVGNILGTIIPSFWADCDGDEDPWGWSFLVPSFIIFGLGIVMFFMLVVDPTHVGLAPPRHNTDESEKTTPPESQSNGTYSRLPPVKEDITDEDDKKREARHKERDLLSNDVGINSIQSSTIRQPHPEPKPKSKAVNILRAFLIPGVIEFSLALFFDKLVSYTFLYWLPLYVKHTLTYLSGPESDWLSTLFDVGGIIGGILAGVISDQLRARALTCVVMLILAIPSLFVLEAYASASFGWFIAMLIICGTLVNGPYAMITTAVSSDLGTHKSLQNNQNAKATVTAIIDGTGSLGAAFGPLIIGLITNNSSNWMPAFYVLMGSCALSALLLTRLVIGEIKSIFQRCRNQVSQYRERSQRGYTSIR